MLIYSNIVIECDTLNKSTYIIPKADICIGNSYYFKNRTKCIHAEGRDKYCIGNDSHFCSLQSTGICKNYYQVECG